MRSLPFLFYEAWVNLRRHGLMTAAAITTIAVALALLGSFALTFYQVTVATHRAVSEFEMQVYCRESVKKSQLKPLQGRLKALPGVAEVGYISKEKAFADQTRNLPIDTSDIPNQFNETFVIKMRDPALAPDVAATVRSWKDVVQEVALPQAEMRVMLRIADFLRNIGLVGGAVLLFGALVVVSNTVRISLFARRREIKIMQIVGASPLFIRLPLFIEGLIHGVVGGAIAALLLVLTTRTVMGLINEAAPLMTRYFDPVSLRLVCSVVIACGTIIGASGSLLSIRRYLRGV